MKELWNGFPTDQKPKWVTWEQLLQYEKVMTETGIPVKNCSD
ncbi:LPD11 domain-containing protein [Dorea amylophila]